MSSEGATFRENTLATRYQPRQSLPPAFPEVLKEYAREVLREQPADILEWSADYFKKLALETDPLQVKQPPPGHFEPDVEDPERELLTQRMTKAFAMADKEGTGTLPARQMLHVLLEAMSLTPAQARYLLTSDFAVPGADGRVACGTFAKEAVRLVQFFERTGYDFAPKDAQTDAEATVHGLNEGDVEYNFLRIFRLVDEAGTGRLSFSDYQNALSSAPFHLTRRDIRLACLACERNASTDEVEYEKEVPRLFGWLQQAEQFELFDNECGINDDADGPQ